MQKNYCVIGDPVAHSLSPLIHNTLYQRYGLRDYAYSAKRVTAETLPSFVKALENENIRGFNVTMPLKRKIVQSVDKLDESATDSVNTVVVRSGKLHGYSTDATGFRQSLKEINADYTGKNVVFIGCGGAARGLVHDAVEHNATKITILNRTPGKAALLADHKNVFADTLSNIERYMQDCSLLINTTPLGMVDMPGFGDLSFVDLLPKKAIVCDLIYHPPKTKLLLAAEANGNAILNGLPMLVWQAFYAFEHFLGILPKQSDYDAIMELISP